MPAASVQSAATFRGTEMSTSMSFRPRSARLAALMMGSLLAVAVNTTSLCRTTSHIFSRGATFVLAPPRADTSSSNAWAFSVDLLTKVMLKAGSLLKRAMSSSLDIFPAPTMQMFTLFEYFFRSGRARDIISSTAALETETEPLPIFVRVRTSLPMRIPAFSIFAMILPPAPGTKLSSFGSAFSMQCWWQALTWAKIWASPKTSESRPELTSKRCRVAASPECVKRKGSNSSWVRPDCARRKACTHSVAAYLLISEDAKYSSKRLHVESTATSGTM
mmetsp:Transcript_58506/g.187966  ORF Transcript_58506/g.187966 Transcript_58506/m.187966 type:complete len:276 (+) Transcript_58506:450-1277(+)